MEKLRRLGLIIIGILVIVGVLYVLFSLFKPKVAGVFIETVPTASVLINGKDVGRTPFRTTIEPGEVIVLLIPEGIGVPLVPYETKVTLAPGVETVMRREFGDSDEASAGEIISFERISKNEVSLAVVTEPDSAQIAIDDSDRAYTPYRTSSITPGEHTLVIAAEGYLPRVVRVKTHKGYKLTAFVKLGLTSENLQKVTPTITPSPEVMQEIGEVEILETSTGFLRVRETPSSLGKELGRVVPGETYPLIQKDARTGWFKIEFEEGAFGWISNQYARKLEAILPTPSDEVTPATTLMPTPTI